MKNLLITMIASCILLFACKKDVEIKEGAPGLKKYQVNFKVDGFKIEIADLLKSKAKLAALNNVADTSDYMNKVDELWYLAYNSAGEAVSVKRWPFLDPEADIDSNAIAGNVTDSLTAGNYTIIFVAAKPFVGINGHRTMEEPSLATNGLDLPLSTAFVSFSYGLLPIIGGGEDIFFKKLNITVESQDIDQTVQLERIVGSLELEIEDAKPGDVFSMVLSEAYYAYSFLEETPIQLFMNNPEENVLNHPNKGFILNTISPFSVTISGHDAENNVTVTKIVNQVRCFKNKRTILKGKLFDEGNSSPQSFVVTVKDEWDTDTISVPY